MSFGSFLKGIIPIVTSFIPGVSTGAQVAKAALGVGGAALGASEGRGNARVAEAGLNADEDKLALQRAASEQNNARQNAVTSQNLRDDDQSNAVFGGYRQGVQDVHFNRPSGVEDTGGTGGARPSAIVGLSDMGKSQKDAALARIAAGYPTFNTKTPELTPVPEANGFDKFLNVAGGLSGLAGLVNNLKGAPTDAGSGTIMPTAPVDFHSEMPALTTEMPTLEEPELFPKKKLPNVFGAR